MGLPDVGHYPELFVALLDSGLWAIEDLKKLAGLNFLRVLKAVEKVGRQLASVARTHSEGKYCFNFQLLLKINLLSTDWTKLTEKKEHKLN